MLFTQENGVFPSADNYIQCCEHLRQWDNNCELDSTENGKKEVNSSETK